MCAEQSGPYQGNRPSEPPRGNAPGQPGNLGPGITPPGPGRPGGPAGPSGPGGGGLGSGPVAPPGQGGPGSGGSRYCANCGKQWPADTKFCTACGTWMEGGEQQQGYRDHIQQQMTPRQEQLVPSFVQQGPPKKASKGRSPLITALIILLSAVIIIGALGYTFLKGPIYVSIGKFMSMRGRYTEAADWFNAIRQIQNSGTWYKKATDGMTDASLKLYGEYLDAMAFKDWTANLEIKNGGEKIWRIYHSSDGQIRWEYAQGDKPSREDEVIIEDDENRYAIGWLQVRGRFILGAETTTPLDEKRLKGRKKAEKDKTLEALREVTPIWHIRAKTKTVNKKKCYVLTANIAGGKKGEFHSLSGLHNDDPGMSGAQIIEFYVGVEDKLLHRIVALGQGQDSELATWNFEDIEIGADIPDSAFDASQPTRKLE